MKKIIYPRKIIKGIINLPGDKSISHRAIILGAIANGETKIKNFLFSKTCMTTLNCLKDLGAEIKINAGDILINGKGLFGLKESKKILNAGTSGTTLRLLLGLLAAQKFKSRITCEGSLKNRPMERVLLPLKEMGAKIKCDSNNIFEITPSEIFGMKYKMPVASAQVKSSILLASLYLKDHEVEITEKKLTRDHTENMINYFGGNIIFNEGKTKILSSSGENLKGKEIIIPGDISSAAFFIVLALLIPDSHLILKNVLVNPRRMGLIKILRQMGAKIFVKNSYEIYDGELVADIEIFYSKINGIEISGQTVVDMIDEIPVFVVACLFANGISVIKNAEELRVKESDRIMSVVENFNRLGANVKECEDGMIIENKFDFKAVKNIGHKDHRIAMSLVILFLVTGNKLILEDAECIDDSMPDFFDYLETFF